MWGERGGLSLYPPHHILRSVTRDLAGGVSSSRAKPDSQYYAMVCSHCQGRHWFSTVYTNPQVTCPQCHKPTPFNQLVEDDTRSGPLGTGKEGRVEGQNYAATCNQAEEAAAEEAGGRVGPSNRADPGARYDDEQAEKKRKHPEASKNKR